MPAQVRQVGSWVPEIPSVSGFLSKAEFHHRDDLMCLYELNCCGISQNLHVGMMMQTGLNCKNSLLQRSSWLRLSENTASFTSVLLKMEINVTLASCYNEIL